MPLISKSLPTPLGGTSIGSFKVRLPTLQGEEPGVYAQIFYPADTSKKLPDCGPYTWFRDEAIEGMAKSNGTPPWILQACAGKVPSADPPHVPVKGPNDWPIIIFCHGLLGGCELYTQLSREIASLGYIVASLEMEDGTAVYAVDGKTGDTISYVEDPSMARDIHNLDQEHFTEMEMAFRAPQIAKRCSAIAATVKLFIQMRKGHGPAVQGGEQKALQDVIDCSDVSRFVLVTHSFGSTTAVHFFHDPVHKGLPFVGAIIGDVWWQPDANEMKLPLPVPFIQVLSEEWLRGANFMKGATGAINLHKGNKEKSLGLVWLKGTKHTWCCDFIYFFPPWLARLAGLLGSGKPDVCMAATAKLMKACLEALVTNDDLDCDDKRAKFQLGMDVYSVEQGCCTSDKVVVPYVDGSEKTV